MIRKAAVCSHFISRLCHNAVPSKLMEWEQIKSKYSDKQLTSVLKTLNKAGVNTLKRYGLPKSQISLLQSSKEVDKNTFTSLDDIISKDIMKAVDLDNICLLVITKKAARNKAKIDSPQSQTKKFQVKDGNQIDSPQSQTKKFQVKYGNQIDSPQSQTKKFQNVDQVVGLRIRAGDVSWCHLKLSHSNCHVDSWDCKSLADLPLQADFPEAIKAGLSLAEAIPNADAYVMEKESTKTGTQTSSSMLRIRMRQEQIISVIMTSLALRNNPNDFFSGDTQGFFHLMKPYTTAKLFGLFLNGETVSSINITEALLQQQDVGLKNVSLLSCGEEMENTYFSTDQRVKEEMSRSLLMTMAFLETIVQRR